MVDGLLEIGMTVEQAAAVRIILKVSHIYAVGELMRQNTEDEFFERLNGHITLTDKWSCLDRPFAIALHNKIYNGPKDEFLSLSTPLKVYLSPDERDVIAEIINDSNFLESLKNAKDKGPGWFKGFVSVVVVERNAAALQEIFSHPAPVSESPPFWFQQQATKEIN